MKKEKRSVQKKANDNAEGNEEQSSPRETLFPLWGYTVPVLHLERSDFLSTDRSFSTMEALIKKMSACAMTPKILKALWVKSLQS